MHRRLFFILILFVIFACINNDLIAQQDDIPLPKSLQPYKPRKEDTQSASKVTFFVGGGFGLQLGNKSIGIDVSPQIGIYPVIKWLALGINATYMFSHDGYYNYNLHVFGGGLFIEAYPIKWLILHSGYEYLNYPEAVLMANGKVEISKRIGTHAFMVGPGYRQCFSDKVNGYFLALFNLYQDETSIYTGYIPTFRVGITVDF